MLKRGTVLLLLGAIALGSGVLLLESRQRPPADKRSAADSLSTSASGEAIGGDKEGDKKPIFPFAEADVESLTVKRPDGTLAFSKSADGTWQMTEPQKQMAESGAIAFLLDEITRPTVRTLSVKPDTLSDFGLANPNTTVTLVANGSTYQLAVGSDDFTGDKLYVQATEPEPKSSDSVEVYLVSGGLKNAVNRPTSGWLAAAEPTEKSTTAESAAKEPAAAAPTAASESAAKPATP